MIKLFIGGSPCTYWSIAQKNNRETEASGMGWELFKNYLIAKEKFQPDFFLYENNKSASPAIKEQIKKELDATDEESQSSLFSVGAGARYIEINSALVSAQNRQRFYIHNCGDVKQPNDRGILLRDIIETGTSWRSKSPCIDANYYKASNGTVPMQGSQSSDKIMVAEPINITADGKSIALKAQYYKDNISNFVVHQNAYGYKSSGVAEPIRIGIFPAEDETQKDSQATRIYSVEGKSRTIIANGGGQGAKTGLYAVDTSGAKTSNAINVYEVKDGLITIKGKQYPIKLKDGHYIIRKLTVTECCRLQTMPDDYCRAVSNTQAYKGLGNGWTAEVIIHILHEALKDVPKDEEIVVLSMYDGIGTGRYCLDKMGFTNIKYYAYEVDKYAIKVATSNYPDIIECGNAFQLREDTWKLN